MEPRKKEKTHVALPSKKNGGTLENNYISFYSLSPNYPLERPRTMAPRDAALELSGICAWMLLYTHACSGKRDLTDFV